MGKWVQKGGYRKKKCTKRKYTFHSVGNMCMVIRKKIAKPRLGGSLQVSVVSEIILWGVTVVVVVADEGGLPC